MNWKHYVGTFLSFEKNYGSTDGYEYNSHTRYYVQFEDRYISPTYVNIGIDYFGKIDLNKRLSVQYLFYFSNYLVQITSYDKVNLSYNSFSRVGMNFGLGWHF